jgi:IS30 family transposase
MLTANEQQSIRTLAERGCSRRRIAWELGLLRETAGWSTTSISPR